MTARFARFPDFGPFMDLVALVLSAGLASVVAWLILRAVRQSGCLRQLVPSPAPSDGPAVAVIVPARDEAANIGLCLDRLAAQTYPASRLAVVVVDDQSSDATAAIAADAAARDDRIALVRTPPLPTGWVGKPHACWIGARAVDAEAEWLCFVDADVRTGPDLIATAAATAEAEELDFLSLAPHQDLGSFAERLVMPCGFYLLAFRQDLRRMQAPDSGEATATGQFILVRRAAYEAIGGHAAVRGVISEDVELARLAKRAGFAVALHGGERLLATRMYTGWTTLWPGVAKNLVDMLGGPAATVAIALAGIVLAWAVVLVPLFALFAVLHGASAAAIAALALAAAAFLAAFGLHLAGTAFFRIPVWYGAIFPLGYTLGALMALDSVRLRRIGRVGWKGRRYAVGGSAAPPGDSD